MYCGNEVILDVVPIGYSGVRIARGGYPIRVMYLAVVKPKKYIARVFLTKHRVNIIDNIELFWRYTTKFIKSSDGTLVLTKNSKFGKGVPIYTGILNHTTVYDFMREYGIKCVPLYNISDYLSRQRSDGYVDDTDWRVVRGKVIKKNIITRHDGTKYTIVMIEDSDILIFCPHDNVRYGEKYDFYGELELIESQCTMSAYLIVPVGEAHEN